MTMIIRAILTALLCVGLAACGEVATEAGEDATVDTLSHAPTFIRGADISSLTKVEDRGVTFFDPAKGNHAKEKDPVKILRSYGANLARLRAFVDPKDLGGYNDTADTIRLAKRAKKRGMKILLDLHYSDFWADPDKQYKPEAWATLSQDDLVQAVYDYTHCILTAMVKAKVAPEMVQIGNEIQSGLLWPDGKTWGEGSGGFPVTAALLNAGIAATRDVLGEKVEIVLHLADGGDNDLYTWWFDNITQKGVRDFDIIGLSYYPYWHGTLDALSYNTNDISKRYDKDVLVVETSYGFTLESADSLSQAFTQEEADTAGYEVSPAGQAAFLSNLTQVIRDVPKNRGRGFIYWEPLWLAVPFETLEQSTGWCYDEGYGYCDTAYPGNAWENQALFDFRGNALESLKAFRPSSTPKSKRYR